MKLRAIWNLGSEKLADKDNGRADARLLLMHLLQLDYTQFILSLEQEQNEEIVKQFNHLVTDLNNGRPLQYILGYQEFMGLKFTVNKSVLIPRGDTEILVNETIKLAKQFTNLNIADIGTGSGAIAVTLASHLPRAQLTAVDISDKALAVAKLNAINNGTKNIHFIHGDLLEPLILSPKKYHIIVSNPPYISTQEMQELPQNVLNEPHLALEGGRDGLDFYRRLAQEAPKVLSNNGYLIVEIGSSQDEEVKRIFSNNGFNDLKIYKDFAKLPRVVVGKLMKPL